MSWYVPVSLHIVVGYALFPWVIKSIAGLPSRTTRFLVMYGFCAIVSVVVAAAGGYLPLDATTGLIVVVGFFNGLAAFCQWRAIDISLTKNSVFTFWDDIIAIGLGFVILSEGQFLNLFGVLGLLLSIGAVIAYVWYDFRKARGKAAREMGEAKTDPRFFYLYVLIYSVIWGVALFLMRKWGLDKVPLRTFTASWYSGAFVAALLIFRFYQDKNPQQQTAQPLGWRGLGGASLLGLLVLASIIFSYSSFERAPLTVVQPLFLVAQMILPALIGLFGFAERKNLTRTDWALLGAAGIGGLMVAFSYQSG